MTKNFLYLVVVGISLSLSGCATTPEADEQPPPPVTETVIVQPGPTYVWVPGEWAWYGERWVWVRGYWGVPPHPHARWVCGCWHHGRWGRRTWRTGHWA